MKIMKLSIVFFLMILAAISYQFFSTDAMLHSYTTGAPSSGSCMDCHSGATINPAGGSLIISIAGNPSTLVPGQTYSVSITANFNGRSRFGFNFSARDQNNQVTGTLSTAGNTNVQIASNTFMTHTLAGTTATGGNKTWTFSWTAPSTPGQVTLRAFANASNSDNSTDGDFIYSSTLVKDVSTGINDLLEAGSLRMYPIPAADNIRLEYTLKKDEQVKIVLTDVSGREVKSLLQEKEQAGSQAHVFQLPALQSGVYFMQMQIGSSVSAHKILLQ